jgi:hypothetical protein
LVSWLGVFFGFLAFALLVFLLVLDMGDDLSSFFWMVGILA